MNCIDLRSDTFTWPTQEMRDAMHVAEVGKIYEVTLIMRHNQSLFEKYPLKYK